MGIGSKLRLIALSNVNALLDKAIDLKSIDAVKQRIRDFESSIDEMRDDEANAEGYVKTVTRERDALVQQAAQLQKNIDFLLTDDDPSNDVNATAFQVRLDTLQTQIDQKNTSIADLTETVSKLKQALSVVEAKHQQMIGQLSSLESLDEMAKAKAHSARTADLAQKMVSDSADASVDDVAARIQRNADVADVKFTHAFEGLEDSTSKDVAFSQASMNVAKRKQELAARAAEHSVAATVSAPTPVAS